MIWTPIAKAPSVCVTMFRKRDKEKTREEKPEEGRKPEEKKADKK